MADAVAKAEPNTDAKILDCASGDGAVGSCVSIYICLFISIKNYPPLSCLDFKIVFPKIS